MTTTIRAVYQGGLLRPAEPLDLPDGAAVDLTVSAPTPPPSEEEVVRRIRAAKTLEEWIEASNAAPPPDDGYDLIEAMEENRRLEGRAPLFPPDDPGAPR